MNPLIHTTYRLLNLLGADPLGTARALAGLPRFTQSMLHYARKAEGSRFPLQWRSLYPILTDFRASAGTARGHYFHQDLWAAKKIFARSPARHVDIGSRVDGFVAHLLVFMPVEVVDIRPLESQVPGLHFIQEDATMLRLFADESLSSISSLHAVEHFGLGRYGDSIDPDGWRLAMGALARVLAPQGRLYFSVPIGRERLEFNAHRVFSVATVLEAVSDLSLVSFSAVNDSGDLAENTTPDAFANAEYACGLFEFTKV